MAHVAGSGAVTRKLLLPAEWRLPKLPPGNAVAFCHFPAVKEYGAINDAEVPLNCSDVPVVDVP